MSWSCIREDVVVAIHDEQIAEHGGPSGVRDIALVQSALARPRNLSACGDPDVAALAAAYAYGLARNHGFLDGNKRTAYVVALVFLLANGFELIASGQIQEDALADWFRLRIRS